MVYYNGWNRTKIDLREPTTSIFMEIDEFFVCKVTNTVVFLKQGIGQTASYDEKFTCWVDHDGSHPTWETWPRDDSHHHLSTKVYVYSSKLREPTDNSYHSRRIALFELLGPEKIETVSKKEKEPEKQRSWAQLEFGDFTPEFSLAFLTSHKQFTSNY